MCSQVFVWLDSFTYPQGWLLPMEIILSPYPQWQTFSGKKYVLCTEHNQENSVRKQPPLRTILKVCLKMTPKERELESTIKDTERAPKPCDLRPGALCSWTSVWAHRALCFWTSMHTQRYGPECKKYCIGSTGEIQQYFKKRALFLIRNHKHNTIRLSLSLSSFIASPRSWFEALQIAPRP